MFYKSIFLIALVLLTIALCIKSQTSITMKSINANAPVKCSKSIVINADSKKVWQLISNINGWSSWQTAISKPQLQGELQPGAKFVWKTGGATIHSTLHTVAPYSAFGWTGKTFGMYAIHNWTVKESNCVTTVSVEESMEGLLASLLKGSFNKNLEKGMLQWLALLKTEAEK